MVSTTTPGETLERLHLKLAMCESDQQLQTFTNNHLLEIINIAGGNIDLVPKVQEMLSHYNRRVRNNVAILLPAASLLKCYVTASPVASTLCLMYLRLSRERISTETQIELLPVYLEAVDKRISDVNQCYDLLSLAMPGFVALSELDKPKWPEFSISTAVQQLVLRFFRTVVVFGSYPKQQMEAFCHQISAAPETVSGFPGLSSAEFLMVAKKVVVENASTNNLKLAIVKLLTAGLFDERASFPLFVLASSLSNNALDDAASSALKKVDIQNCVDDKTVVEQLMSAYLGSAAMKTKPAPKDTVYKGSMLMKLKILPFLTRSEIAATSYMNNIKICLDVLAIETSQFPKLQAAGLQFVLKVIERMPTSALGSLGPSLFQRLKNAEKDGDLDSASMCLVLRCMGALGKAQPALVFSDLAILTQLFSTISLCDENTAYAVVDCLVAWLPAFCRSTDSTNATKLKELVATYATHVNAKCRLVALKYVEALLSSSEMDVKWLLLNASGDTRDEMRNEASRLLEMSLRTAVPSVEFAAEFISNKLSRDLRKTMDFTDSQLPLDENSLSVVPEVHQMCSRYLWAVCESASGGTPELRIVEGDEHWRLTSPKIAHLVKGMNRTVAQRMTAVALLATKETHDVHLFRIVSCFVFASSFDVNQSLLTAAAVLKARNSTRVELASCASMLASRLTASADREDSFKKHFEELKTSPLGGLCWLAASFVSSIDGSASETIPLARQLLTRLVELADEGYQRPGSLLEAALGSLATVLRNFFGEKDLGLSDEEFSGIIMVCEKIAASRKDSLSMKSREEAVEVIGLLVTKDDTEERRKQVVSSLYRIGEGPPQPELQLTTGAALWDACLGTNSAARRNPYLEAESDRKVYSLDANSKAESEKLLAETMTTVIDQKLRSGNHHLRRAALVWLLVLVQKCGVAEFSLDSMLDSIQGAFADGLTETDDFTQDIASKGMGVVYQMAGAEHRKALVAGLMTSLAEGRRSTTKVQADTVIFNEGQLGKSPDGSNLTTYKELCSLATDLNQPDLVYKFMQLAKHNATWNAKKGAAFGFGAILEQAREELDPYVGQLVPKLFRYRYDPDMKVQQSMRSIWTVLTQTRRNVVDEFADEIFRELTSQLTHKEWRVRESSCLALSDLLRGHDTALMHGQVPEILSVILRVKDDVKESVRLAAERTAESIRKLIVKLSSSTNRERADAFLSTLLPVLIEKGVNSSIKANKGFSLGLLIELAKTAGPQLRPYLSQLIPVLLDAISDCESAVLNYLAVRSSNTQLEALDDARAQMARTSPMMTAIYDILPQIDSDVLVGMQPKVCDQLRASVGVSTRAAASQLITQLALRAPQLMMGHQAVCDKFFTALVPGVRDRNPSIRKNFANAMSYLAKFASNSQMNSLVKQIAKDLVSENDDMKQATKHVLRNLLAHCPEIVKGYASDIVPYVFLETCQEVIKGDDASKKRQGEWSEVWGDLVPSTDAAVRLYRAEIIAVAVDTLQNNAVWVVRAQAGRMLARTAEALGDAMDADEAVSLVSTLLPLLSGRVWKGKENILTALAAVINSSGDVISSKWTAEQMGEVLTILQREASKRNKEYSSAGVWTCAVFASSMANTSAADWLLAKINSNVQKALNPIEDGSSDDDSLTNLEKEAELATMVGRNLVAMVKALGAYRQGGEAVNAVDQLCSYIENQNLYWKARQDMVVALLDTVEKWQLTSALPSSRLVESLLIMADEMCEHQRKTIASQCLLVVMKMAERRLFFSVDWDAVAIRLRDSRAASETGLSSRLESAMEVD